MPARTFSFVAGAKGHWRIQSMKTLLGEPLEMADRLAILDGFQGPSVSERWILHGSVSNGRYTTRTEHERLVAAQPSLGRPEATCAVLIPLRKNAAWWALTQDERRAIFEERSHHIEIGERFLPAIARRLHHCRDLGDAEPFDFLTWFEFAPEHVAAFHDLLGSLRASEEWKFVDREVEIRLGH